MNISTKVELGTVKIHKNVIISIASIAAMEAEGVKEIANRKAISFFEILNFKKSNGIKAEFNKNDEICMEVPLIVKYGYSIPDIAEHVQDNIRNAIEKMVDKTPKDININIQGIVPPDV